jgi:hypothetical protein
MSFSIYFYSSSALETPDLFFVTSHLYLNHQSYTTNTWGQYCQSFLSCFPAVRMMYGFVFQLARQPHALLLENWSLLRCYGKGWSVGDSIGDQDCPPFLIRLWICHLWVCGIMEKIRIAMHYPVQYTVLKNALHALVWNVTSLVLWLHRQ